MVVVRAVSSVVTDMILVRGDDSEGGVITVVARGVILVTFI